MWYLKKIINRTFNKILSIFYNKKYLTGKYFEGNSLLGIKKCISFFFSQKILGNNRSANWPVSPRTVVLNGDNLIFDNNDMQNFWHYGCYFQNFSAKIYLGKGTYIAPNVGIITSNHDLSNLDNHSEGKDVVLGESCWIGMNSVILPGVHLGNNTIVGAGSVVTKSFPNGNIVIAGNPAKVIRGLSNESKK